MKDFFFRINLLQLKVGCFLFFHIKLIHQMVKFLSYLIFTKGANNGGGRCIFIDFFNP